MPAILELSGLRIEYPENWSVELSDEGQEAGQVIISSPETAFWHLSQHPPDAELEPIFDEVLAALRDEYGDIEVEPASQGNLEDFDLEGYNVNFICLDLTNTCWLRVCRTPSASLLLICQAEDREFERVSAVFLAMLASVLRNLG
ncbi:MAG: hypothetical protein KDA57_13005 [Planctomycetales bacterium]|nr:hypothetical protein [Planctomycetales bacterium]